MLTIDRSGQYRRDLGWKPTAAGGLSQQRFYLGRDRGAAAAAEDRLAKFWDALGRYFAAERDGEKCLWEEWSLAIAKQVAGGSVVVRADLPGHAGFRDEAERVLLVAAWRSALKKYFGTIFAAETESAAQADQLQIRRGQFHADLGRDILASAGRTPTGETLHGAIDGYVAHLHGVHRTAEGVVSQTGKKQGERAARLKRHHADLPLCDLGAGAIEGVLLYWGRRPLDATGKRYSHDTCKNQLILIRAFLRWAHRSDLQWKLPPDYLFPRSRIVRLPSEISAAVKVRTFTAAEVGALWRHATPLERTFIALGVNCGFGTAEIATLAEAEIGGNFVKRLRHKTGVFGKWWLFPATRGAIAWARRRKEVQGLASDYLLVSDSGKPYFAVTSGNNNNQKIRNSWNRLLGRVRAENPDFPRLSFGKLRKTSATWVRKLGGGETASVFIAHGKATGDTLLDRYADRNFRKLFRCQRKIWGKLSEHLAGEFPEPVRRQPTSRRIDEAAKARMRALRRQGRTLTDIAELMGTSVPTVSRIVNGTARKAGPVRPKAGEGRGAKTLGKG